MFLCDAVVLMLRAGGVHVLGVAIACYLAGPFGHLSRMFCCKSGSSCRYPIGGYYSILADLTTAHVESCPSLVGCLHL